MKSETKENIVFFFLGLLVLLTVFSYFEFRLDYFSDKKEEKSKPIRRNNRKKVYYV